MKRRTRLLVSIPLVLLILIFVLLLLNKTGNITQTLLGGVFKVHLVEDENPVDTHETVEGLYPFKEGVLSLQQNSFAIIRKNAPEEAATKPSPIPQSQVAFSNPYTAFYQEGGTALKLLREDRELCTIDTPFPILSASVNEDGDCVIITEDSGHKSAVSVYRKDGTMVYRWHSGAQLAMSAVNSTQDDLVICTLDFDETQPLATLYLFDLKKPEPILKQDMGNRIPTFVDVPEKNLILVGFSDGLCAFRRNGETVYAINCNEARLKGWSVIDPYSPRLLVLENGQSIVRFYDQDRLTGEYAQSEDISLFAAFGNLAVVSTRNQISLVDSHGRLLAKTETAKEVRKLQFLDKKTIAAAMGNEVRFLKIK